MLPGLLAMSAQLEDSVGTRPWFQGATLPLDVLNLRLLLSELSGTGTTLLIVGVLFIWIMQLSWQAGAMTLLNPSADTESRKVFANGRPFVGRFIRIAIFALIGLVAVHLVIKYFHNILSVRAELEGWSVRQSYVSLQLWRLGALFIGLNIVGTFAFWARVITVADGRRYLRRVPRMVLRLFWRRPLAALLLQVVAIAIVLIVQAVALWFWRQSSGSAWYLLPWAALLLLAAYVWQLRIQSALAIWNGDRVRDLRLAQDKPWHWRLPRSRARRAQATAVPQSDSQDTTSTVEA
jgi:hypothetical protein